MAAGSRGCRIIAVAEARFARRARSVPDTTQGKHRDVVERARGAAIETEVPNGAILSITSARIWAQVNGRLMRARHLDLSMVARRKARVELPP